MKRKEPPQDDLIEEEEELKIKIKGDQIKINEHKKEKKNNKPKEVKKSKNQTKKKKLKKNINSLNNIEPAYLPQINEFDSKTPKILKRIIKREINKFLALLPLKNIIMFESRPDCSGSSKAVFDELINRGQN